MFPAPRLVRPGLVFGFAALRGAVACVAVVSLALAAGCASSSDQAPPTAVLELSTCPDCECVGCEVCDAGDCCCAETSAGPVMVGVSAGGAGTAGDPVPDPDPAPEPSPDPPADAGPVFGAVREQLSRDGQYLVRVATAPDPIPFNLPFQLRVTVLDGEDRTTPLAGSTVAVAGWMPDHGHGMTRFPRVEAVDDGRFLVHGMLFHMSGLWEIQVDVIHAGLSSRADFEVELE